MSALEIWRQQIRPLIPRGFLRRDQGEGLLISDFPRFPNAEEVLAALRRMNFETDIFHGMALIDGTIEKYGQLQGCLRPLSSPADDESLPLYALGKKLMMKEAPLEYQPMELIRFTLKCLDAKDDEALLRLLPPQIALLQRQHLFLPSMAGTLILDDLYHRAKGEIESC